MNNKQVYYKIPDYDLVSKENTEEIEWIKSKIKNSVIRGRQIDNNSTDELILAAYYFGKYEDYLYIEEKVAGG